MLRRVDINIVSEVFRDGVCALVLVLAFRRVGSRRTCAGFAPDLVHGDLEIIDNRGEFLRVPVRSLGSIISRARYLINALSDPDGRGLDVLVKPLVCGRYDAVTPLPHIGSYFFWLDLEGVRVLLLDSIKSFVSITIRRDNERCKTDLQRLGETVRSLRDDLSGVIRGAGEQV